MAVTGQERGIHTVEPPLRQGVWCENWDPIPWPKLSVGYSERGSTFFWPCCSIRYPFPHVFITWTLYISVMIPQMGGISDLLRTWHRCRRPLIWLTHRSASVMVVLDVIVGRGGKKFKLPAVGWMLWLGWVVVGEQWSSRAHALLWGCCIICRLGLSHLDGIFAGMFFPETLQEGIDSHGVPKWSV